MDKYPLSPEMCHNLCYEYFHIHKHHFPIQSTVDLEEVIAIFTRALQDAPCRSTPLTSQMAPTPLSAAFSEHYYA